MESLVIKLNGSVNDDSLRKINEGTIKFNVLGVNKDEVGAESTEVYITMSASSPLSFRSGREGLTYSYDKGQLKLSNIEDGDVIYIENANTVYQISKIQSFATSNGTKYIKLSDISGFPSNMFTGNFSTNDIYIDTNDFIPSDKITGFSWQNSSNIFKSWGLYSNDVQFDIESLYNKFPNLQAINLSSLSLNIKDMKPISKFKSLMSFTYAMPQMKSVIDIDPFYGMDLLTTISIDGNEGVGDYFKIIDGSSKLKFSVSGTFKYNDETFKGSQLGEIGGTNFYVDGDIDQMLINLANNATHISGGSNTIKISSYRTSASDSAIQTLQSKGWTISIPGGGSAAAASTMSVMSTMSLIESNEKVESGNYRIAYQGNQLIIEPTEFPIYPAAGVTVKEFQALEEANEFISENNLSTEVE